MSLTIRAALLYNLTMAKVTDIHSHVIIEILYQNGMVDQVVEFSYYRFLCKDYQPGNIGIVPYCDENITQVFRRYPDKIVEAFQSKGYSLEEVSTLAYFLSDVICAPGMKGQIVINNWKYSKIETIGMQYEKIAINILTNNGIIIGGVPSRNTIIRFTTKTGQNFNITLNGRPDGEILASPGNVFRPGTMIEIKHKPELRNRNSHKNRDEMQMCAYSLIFRCDILYVRIFNNQNIDCELYTQQRLSALWDSKYANIIQNCETIGTLIANFLTDEKSMDELIKLAL